MKSTFALFVLLAATAGIASAQNAPAPAATAPAPAPAGTSVAPQDPIQSVAPARAQADGSRIRLENAREEINEYVRIQRILFENSAAYTGALADRQRAYEAFDSARKSALAALENDTRYFETRRLRDETAKVLAYERSRPTPDTARIDGLSTYRMNLARQVSDRETEALKSDTMVASARQNLADATAKVDALKKEFSLRLATGDQLASARRSVRDLRVDYAVAVRYAQETARTADILMDYAYYIQWLNATRPYVITSPIIPYAYSPYGYGGNLNAAVSPTGLTPVGIGYGYVPYSGQ